MRLVYEKQPAKMLSRMPRPLAQAIRKDLAKIALDPFAHHANVEPLAGTKHGFRLRHGPWRILYRVDVSGQAMVVTRVRTRGDVY